MKTTATQQQILDLLDAGYTIKISGFKGQTQEGAAVNLIKRHGVKLRASSILALVKVGILEVDTVRNIKTTTYKRVAK